METSSRSETGPEPDGVEPSGRAEPDSVETSGRDRVRWSCAGHTASPGCYGWGCAVYAVCSNGSTGINSNVESLVGWISLSELPAETGEGWVDSSELPVGDTEN